MKIIFRKLPKDILLKTVLNLDLPDILNLCKSDEKINEKLCENENNWFWIEKLQKDFYIDYDKLKKDESPKNIYFKLCENFNDALEEILNEGYPEKLKNHLIKSGYIKEFQNEISKLLGPYYGKEVNTGIYDDIIYQGDKNINEILEKYFFDGGSQNGYDPLEDIYYDFLLAFRINEL